MRLGQRLPLAEVALRAGRPDITVAVVMARAATRVAISSLEATTGRSQGELVSAAYLDLRETILPSIARRLGQVPLSEARTTVPPLLEQVLKDAYLVTSIGHALGESLARDGERRKRETRWSEEAELHVQRAPHGAWLGRRDEGELAWGIEQALASFGRRPGAAGLDRKLVAARRRWPDVSVAEIARRIGEPVRTAQYHHHRLLEYVRKQLEI